MTLPNFLVIGAAKSGTTSLLAYLKQHPEIFVSRSKEPNYFAFVEDAPSLVGPAPPHILEKMIYNWSRTDYAAYTALFDAAEPGHRAIGEGSVRYLYFPKAAAHIRETLPDVRLVAMLRDPVSRLYSHYNMNRQMQIEPLSLTKALEAEPERIAAGWGWDWHYKAASLYGAQLQRYYDLFPKEQIKVFLYDDFVADPVTVISEICAHIGVSPDFLPNMEERGMVTRLPRHLLLDRLLNWPSRGYYWLRRPAVRSATLPIIRRINAWNSQPIPKLAPELRQKISEEFRDDLAHLSDLIGRPVPWYA